MRLPGAVAAFDTWLFQLERIRVRGVAGSGGEYKVGCVEVWRCGVLCVRNSGPKCIEFRFLASRSGLRGALLLAGQQDTIDFFRCFPAGHRTPATGHRTTDQRPPDTGHRPPDGNRPPDTGQRTPATGHRTADTGKRTPATARTPATGHCHRHRPPTLDSAIIAIVVVVLWSSRAA